jgi:hypothetical protein
VGYVLWTIESCEHLSATKHSIGQLFGGGSSAKLVHAVKNFMWAPSNGRFNHVSSFLKQVDHVGAFLQWGLWHSWCMPFNTTSALFGTKVLMMWAPFWYKTVMWVLSYGRGELGGALKSFETILPSFVLPLVLRVRFLAVRDCIGFNAPDGRASLQPLGRITVVKFRIYLDWHVG